MDFFPLFEDVSGLAGEWKFATIGPARDGTTADATLPACHDFSFSFFYNTRV